MKQREIWFADLNPIKGSEQRGIRPVVVISGNAMNDNYNVCIVCPLSSKIKNFAGCLILSKNAQNGLETDSEVITFQIRTLSKERFLTKIGEITPSQLNEIKQGLNDVLTY
jgi:mRNA interferase MazF